MNICNSRIQVIREVRNDFKDLYFSLMGLYYFFCIDFCVNLLLFFYGFVVDFLLIFNQIIVITRFC